MKFKLCSIGFALVFLTGCFGPFKPARSNTRTFILKALPTASATAPGHKAKPVAVGIGPIKFPDYLLKPQLAVRKSPTEIAYLQSDLWAEPLDKGFQRVLAANLALLLPSSQIRLSSWRSSDLTYELYLTVRQFEVDTTGTAILDLQWRIQSPSTQKVLRSGNRSFTQHALTTPVRPEQIALLLSDLTADLSRSLAQSLKGTQPD